MKRFVLLIILISSLPACKKSNKVPVQEPGQNIIEVVVHRGANRLAPENTMSALYKAVENGVDYIEIDVATSSDSIMYCFHDKTLNRTTDGEGIFSEQSSQYIESLDAGSWFSPAFAGEKIPRVIDILRTFKGQAKAYFDVKNANIDELIKMIRNEGYAKDCFVWFSDRDKAKEFSQKAPDIPLKMNASAPDEVTELVKEYHPQIIECDMYKITPALQNACKENNIRLMANLLRDSWWEYKQAIELPVDMVNIDHPDYYHDVLNSPTHEFTDYRLVAHRGGIVEDLYDEFDPRSIQAAIDSGYWMLEIDVRPTADKNIIVHHDDNLKRIYGVDKKISEMNMEELKKLKALKGGYAPMTFDEVTKMCRGKVRFMVDVKPRNPEAWFCKEIKRILEKYDMMDEAYFIRNDIKPYFEKGKFGFRMSEAPAMKERLDNGEDIAAHYYLFDHGNRLNAEVARWCQRNYMDVCASVNIGHYRMEDHAMGAKRDIEHLKKCGVTNFQIDSDYDAFFDLQALK